MPIVAPLYKHTKPKNTRDSFYDQQRWRRLSKRIRENEPLCRECKKNGKITPATLADHIIPRHKGGAEWDEDNIQPLCDLCHQRKRAGEKR